MWTSDDVRNQALWSADVTSLGQPPQAVDAAHADRILSGIWARLTEVVTSTNDRDGNAFTMPDSAAIPDNVALMLAELLECDLRKAYSFPATRTRHSAYIKLMGELVEDNRPLVGDLDGDGVLSEAEEQLQREAAFY